MFNARVLKSGDSVNRYKKLIGIEIFMLVVLFFNSFVLDILSRNLYSIIFWLAILILTVLLVGFEKDKHLNKVDVMQTIFIVSILYLICTYVFGFFFGYVKSIYNLNVTSIISNVTPVLFMIVIQELVRYNIVSKTKKALPDKIIIGVMIAIFVLFDIVIGIKSFEMVKMIGIFETIGLYILPSVAKNLLLTYMAYNAGYKPAILYRIIFDATTYILPIFPDFGTYLQSVLNIAFPTALFLILNRTFKKATDVFSRKNRAVEITIWTITGSVLIVLVMLVSGIFKYYALTIGSGSMEPNLNIGDVVIVEKLKDEELDVLKEGDILVFDNGKVVVHRIVKIYEKDATYSYQTKGDNNDDIDGFIVYENQVIGKAKYRIPLIGKPTVWLSEQLKD